MKNNNNITRKQYIDALIATAEKYFHPEGNAFFSEPSCPMCILTATTCNICPLNIKKETYGCMDNYLKGQLLIDLKGNYCDCQLTEPTDAMTSRAESLKRAASAMKDLSDKEISKANFSKIYPFVS